MKLKEAARRTGKAIKIFRKKKSLKQIDLAELCGFSERTIQLMESGKGSLTLENMNLVARKLGVELSSLIIMAEELLL